MDVSDDALFQAAVTLWIAKNGHQAGRSSEERELFQVALWEVACLAQCKKPNRKQIKQVMKRTAT